MLAKTSLKSLHDFVYYNVPVFCDFFCNYSWQIMLLFSKAFAATI